MINRAGLPGHEPLLLNLGCGERGAAAWVNIDFSLRARLRRFPWVGRLVGGSNPPRYINHDLRKGIPFGDGEADAVYASHVLEHLTPGDARVFLDEMRRVLRPGGTIRLVVPDLEVAAREYLAALEQVRGAGSADAGLQQRYEWNLIWLLDQMVRTRPGGFMGPWLRERRASEFVSGMSGILRQIADAPDPDLQPKNFRERLARWFRPKDPGRSGELHRWMYDDWSLQKLLRDVGFSDIRAVGPAESRISGWQSFELDAGSDGREHQSGSVWMEATR